MPKKSRLLREQERVSQILRTATLDGARTGLGNETAVLCHGCYRPLIISRPAFKRGEPVRCFKCGPVVNIGQADADRRRAEIERRYEAAWSGTGYGR